METSKAKKTLSLVLAIIMLFTMIPTTIFTLASEKSYPMMMRFTAASSADFHKYYKQVYSVTFLDEIDNEAMAGALESWDISANTGSGEVMSWMYLNEEATAQAGQNRYDVYIAGEGGVGANPESGYIFYMFEGLKEIRNPQNFKTGTATTFYDTFYGCFSLEEVDFSSWDVSNVTTIKYMFYRCYGLKYANLSGWDTRNITDMYGVFEMTPPNSTINPVYSLEKVDLTGWNTSSVTTMENMFKNCENLKELDLSSFDTSKVTSMRFMFYYCKQLKNIYVGEGWTTEAIKNINDGVFNCCYAIVGGTDDQTENEKIYIDKHPSAYYPPSVEYAKTKEEGGYLTDVSQKPGKIEYKVTYEFIGDIIPEGITAPTEAVYEEGSKVNIEPTPSAEGYIFSGWSTDDAAVTDNSFTINNDVHFVGSWSKLYKVTYKYTEGYDIPDGAPELPEAVSYKAGVGVNVNDKPFVSGYVFEGWTTDDADVTADGKFVMPEKDVVLYGYFRKPVSEVEINNKIDGAIVLNKDETTTIEVTVRPEDATIKLIGYDSGNDEIVIVDEYGNVTAVGEGTTTITVYSKSDPEIKDTVTVTVKIPVTDITVDKTEINLNKGDKDKITAEVNPEATNKEVTYTSNDETVVRVDENGNIEAVGEGEAIITVTSKDDPTKKETVTVTVKVPVTELTVEKNEYTLNVDDIDKINAFVNEDATNKELIYESDDSGVVKVDSDGYIVAVGEGEATITITSKDDPSKKETVKVTVKVPVTDVTTDKDDITLNVGGKDKITVTVTPDNATDKSVTYESSDETVVKVDENGNIEAVGKGEAIITVTSKDDPTKKETVKVTVEIPVTDVTTDKDDITLDVGGKDKITVTVTPDNATDKSVTYESSDETVVKVDEEGNIEAVGKGEAIITITSKDDPTKKETVKVTVEVPVEDIVVPEDKKDITLDVGDKDKITVTITPDNATDKSVTYKSSDETVVKVDEEGNIEAVGEGEATITITSKDDPTKKETVKVTVEIPVEDIVVPEDKKDITLDVGDKDKITVTVTPDNATDKSVTYESSDETVVKVDEEGNIEAVGKGEAIITITSKDDPTKKETVKVTVEVPVTDVTADKDDITLDVGGKDKITVTVTPDNATNKSVTYESSDETVVKVDEEGNIEAIGEGEATITITSKDDPTKTETVKITVKKPVIPVTGLVADKEEINLEPEGTDKITAFVVPDNATNKEITYKSSDETVVKVDENGNVTAVGEGEAVITVTAKDDPDIFVEIPVKVTAPEEPPEPENIPVEDVFADKSDIILEVGETDKITATVKPDNASEKDVTFKSGDESIVKVDENGNITAVGEGTTTVLIISKADPTKAATVFVTVKPVRVPVDGLTTDREEITLAKGETDKITVTVTPEGATEKGLTYESSDKAVVKVDKNGGITAVGEGEATVTVTSKDDPTKKVTVKITVNKPEYTIEAPDALSIFKGEKKPLGVVITPDDGTIVPTYKSSDESVVKVDAQGNITGVGVGIAVITADFGGGDIRLIPVTVLTVPVKHHVCFGKTDGIGWYEVSVNGGDFFPQGPNSTLEVAEGSILVVRVQDMWIDDEFDFYVNGKKVPLDPANTITVVVDGYMLIGALSMDVPVPDAEESLNIFQKILKAITDFFAMIKSWFTGK